MRNKQKYVPIALTAFLLSAAYVHGALPGASGGHGNPQRPVGRITTKGGQPIKVNGTDVTNGGSIVTGSTVEVPDQVSAMIDLGEAGIVELMPNTKVELEFDANGNVRTKLIAGCAASRKKSSVVQGEMEIYTDQASEKTNKKRRSMAFCFVNGQLVGAAGAAAAGASSGIVGGIVAGDVAGIIIATRGTNPSPISPIP